MKPTYRKQKIFNLLDIKLRISLLYNLPFNSIRLFDSNNYHIELLNDNLINNYTNLIMAIVPIKNIKLQIS